MKHCSSLSSKEILGYLAVFGSAFCFYLSTAAISWARSCRVDIDSSYFAFSRFVLGFILVGLFFFMKKKRPKPVSYHLLMGRAVANCMAVFCFFKAVELTSVAEGNILNMTYPLFVAFLSWALFKQERDPVAVFIVLVSFAGVWMILVPGHSSHATLASLNPDSLWGLLSGISGAIAILYLNRSRKVHDTETILFFMFGGGGILIFLLFREHIFIPAPKEFFFLALCGLVSALGQYLLTAGFRYVTALEGSIISSSRILVAALLGPLLVSEPALSLTGWVGASLIFGGNIYLAMRKASHNKEKKIRDPAIIQSTKSKGVSRSQAF